MMPRRHFQVITVLSLVLLGALPPPQPQPQRPLGPTWS